MISWLITKVCVVAEATVSQSRLKDWRDHIASVLSYIHAEATGLLGIRCLAVETPRAYREGVRREMLQRQSV